MIAIGEIRDRGHRRDRPPGRRSPATSTLTTFHAGSACEVIGRLLDMGIEPYAIRSGLRAVVGQRLVRRLCDACASPCERPEDLLGLPVGARQARPGLRRLPGHRLPGPARAGRDAAAGSGASSAWPMLAGGDVHQLEEIALAEADGPAAGSAPARPSRRG